MEIGEYCNGDISIFFYTIGNKQGIPIILLHGFPDSSKIWRSQAEAVASKGYRAIVPDLRGFGQSSKPADVASYAMGEAAKDVYGLLQDLGIKSFGLVGHDWGAGLAWTLASMTPDRVLAMTVLSVGHTNSFFAAGGNKQRQQSWYFLLFQRQETEELLSGNDWAFFKKLLEGEDPALVEERIAELSKDGALTAGLNWYRANCPVQWFAMTEVAPPANKLPMPILGLWSTEDVFLWEEQLKASAQFVEDELFRYKRVEGAGHWMQLDQADAVSQALVDFFCSVGPNSAL